MTAFFAATLLAGLPGAAAQSRLAFEPDGRLVCAEYTECEPGATCDGTDECLYVDAYESSVCTTPSGPSRDLACCVAGDEVPCPDLGAGTGHCVTLFADSSVCVYPDDPRLACVEATSSGDPRLTTLQSCFTDPTTDMTTRDWSVGDCDRDGIENGAEHEGCLCVPDLSCGEVLDAGVVEPDAGTDDDAGAVEPDAGPDDDAGPGPDDAGSAGKMDGGGMGEEDPLQGIDFRGSGGCSCDGAAGNGVPPAAALAVILGAALARRRRR